MNYLKYAEIIFRSCYNTRNNNYAVAATPERATTQLLQHQKNQLSKAGKNLFCNSWNTGNGKREQQLPKDQQSSMLTQHNQQLTKKGKIQLQLLKHQEQREFTNLW